MAKKGKFYTIHELAEMLLPGQLGMQTVKNKEIALLFRPKDPYSPPVNALLEYSGWREVPKNDEVLQAYPTLENYNALASYGIPYDETVKVAIWRCTVSLVETSFSEAINWSENTPLFPYQQEAARFLYYHDRAMLSLSPGLGKTLTSAYAAGKREFNQVLAIVPASLIYYWKGELEKWSSQLPIQPFITVLHGETDNPSAYTNMLDFPEATQHWLITNPETIVKRLQHLLSGPMPFDALIMDESIMYKHRTSSRSQAMKLLAKAVDVCWLLTGAPATRYLDDMWHQFHILKPKGYASYWRFAQSYCVVEESDWGSKIVANKRGGELDIKKNFADIYFSRTQDDVADIPDWIMEDIDVPMLSDQDYAYNRLRKELLIELKGVDEGQTITVNNHLSLMIRSIQVASNPWLVGGHNSSGKWSILPDLMGHYPGPYIVWVNFIKTGEYLRDMFAHLRKIGETNLKKPLQVALANGATPVKDRNEMVDEFQKGNLDVLILNNQVGKFGFTLTKARTAFFVERAYDDSYFQCLHRNRRIGTTQSPIIVNMRSVTLSGRNTIDHLIHSTLDYRVGMIKKVTAGDLKKVFL